MKRRRRTIKAATMIQIGVAGILLVLLVLLVYWYVDGLSAYKPGEGTFQIMGKTTLEYAPNATFRSSDEGSTVTTGDQKLPLIDTPILYKGEPKFTLSQNMLLMDPNESLGVKRINQFTTVTKSEQMVTFESDGKKGVSYGGFLYDGEDLYVFLDDTKLFIGVVEVTLPPLSYARVQYNSNVEYYNIETGESDTYALHDVDVLAECDGYQLGLGKDVIYTKAGEALLYSAVDNVDVISMK